ncbi:MAG: hypothetical protein AAF804_16110, partial [Bacteroidota bacterium]
MKIICSTSEDVSDPREGGKFPCTAQLRSACLTAPSAVVLKIYALSGQARNGCYFLHLLINLPSSVPLHLSNLREQVLGFTLLIVIGL